MHFSKYQLALILLFIFSCHAFGNSKKYKFDVDSDGQEDELLIHYNKSTQLYDYIEFYLSTQGYFKFRSEYGFDYIPNESGVFIENDGWDLHYWSGPLLIGQFKFDYCITAYYPHIFVLAGDD